MVPKPDEIIVGLSAGLLIKGDRVAHCAGYLNNFVNIRIIQVWVFTFKDKLTLEEIFPRSDGHLVAPVIVGAVAMEVHYKPACGNLQSILASNPREFLGPIVIATRVLLFSPVGAVAVVLIKPTPSMERKLMNY